MRPSLCQTDIGHKIENCFTASEIETAMSTRKTLLSQFVFLVSDVSELHCYQFNNS